MKTIVITGNQLVKSDSTNCTYKYTFPVGTVNFKDKELALSSLSMYYSWPNIHASRYSNNTFSYVWPINGGTQTKTVTIPDGFYTVSDLNAYLQSQMIANGHYLIDGSGNYVYYLEMKENSVYYGVELDAYTVPTSKPTGYSEPSNWVGSYPAAATTPQFVFSGNFCNVIGFSAQTWPSVTTASISTTSTSTPQVTPVSTILVKCDLVDNQYSIPNNIIYGFSPDVTYGSQIAIKPSELTWLDIKDGGYPYFQLTFSDQNADSVPIKDTNICCILAVRDKMS